MKIPLEGHATRLAHGLLWEPSPQCIELIEYAMLELLQDYDESFTFSIALKRDPRNAKTAQRT